MRFTAVVVTWNSAGEVAGLLESIGNHLGEQCELLFVDNASSDETVELIRDSPVPHRVIELSHNAGFAAANNIGVRAAETEVVALLNPDTLLVDDSLADLAKVAAQERALFAPLLLNPDGSLQISARPALGSWEAALVAVWPGALMPGRVRRRCEPWRYRERLRAGWLSGAALVAKRDLLLELGPFDERLYLYGEDADLCVRAWLAGVPSISAGDCARVIHLGGRSAHQAFDDTGIQRKIEARWWVAHERLGAARGMLDLVGELLTFLTRAMVKLALGRDPRRDLHWLRATVRVMRSRRPPAPAALPTNRAERAA